MAENQDNIHDRHQVPQNEDVDEKAVNAAKDKVDSKNPYKNTKQAVRNAHFRENGVRDDGTAPKQKD